MTGFKDVKDLIFSNTSSDLEILSNVIEVPIYLGICSALMYDLSFLLGGQVLWKLPRGKIIGYVYIPR